MRLVHKMKRKSYKIQDLKQSNSCTMLTKIKQTDRFEICPSVACLFCSAQQCLPFNMNSVEGKRDGIAG